MSSRYPSYMRSRTMRRSLSRNCRLVRVSSDAVAIDQAGMVRFEKSTGPDERFSGNGHSGFIYNQERDLTFVHIGTDIQHKKVLQLEGVNI